jgi:hypothetical protein
MFCNTKLEVVFEMFFTFPVPEFDQLWLFACCIYFILYYLLVAGVCDIPPVKCLSNSEVVGFGLPFCPVVSVQLHRHVAIVETLQRRTVKILVHLKVCMMVDVNLYYKFIII